jgi:hypothetical protein
LRVRIKTPPGMTSRELERLYLKKYLPAISKEKEGKSTQFAA